MCRSVSIPRSGRWLFILLLAVLSVVSGRRPAVGATEEDPLWAKAAEAHDIVWQDFVCPDTSQVFTYVDVKTRKPRLPSYEEVLAFRPDFPPVRPDNTGGWTTAIENCALDGGEYLGGLVDRYAVTGRPDDADKARKIYQGLRLLVNAADRRGTIIRGVMSDRKTHYPESSADQYTNYIYGVWRYFHSPIPDGREKAEIQAIFSSVLERLEADNFRILRDDTGGPLRFGDLHALYPTRAERLLAVVLAGADITGNKHWLDVYRELLPSRLTHCRGTGGEPWVLVQNQAAFFVLRGLESDPEVRKVYDRGSLEAAHACVPFLNGEKTGMSRGNHILGMLTIVWTEDKELIRQHLDEIREGLLKYDCRSFEGVGDLITIECIVWSLARQGAIARSDAP